MLRTILFLTFFQFVKVVNCQLLLSGPGDLNELLVIHIPDARSKCQCLCVSALRRLRPPRLGLAIREYQQHLGVPVWIRLPMSDGSSAPPAAGQAPMWVYPKICLMFSI